MPGPLFAFGFSDVVAFAGAVGTILTAVLAVLKFWDRLTGRRDDDHPKPAPPAVVYVRSAGIPGWLVLAGLAGMIFLFCGGCGISLINRARDRAADILPTPATKKGGEGGGGNTDDKNKDKFAGRKVPVNRPIEAWDERIEVKLAEIEFRGDGKMRWHLTIRNATGHEVSVPLNNDTTLTDQNGTRYKAVGHSNANWINVGVGDGETKAFWIDFPAAATAATRLVAAFPRAQGGFDLSSVGVELVPGPDGPGVSPDPLVRRVVLGKPLATWNPQIACTIESVEFRPDGRMRWRWSFWNRTGTDTDIYVYPDPDTTYLTDEKGTKYPGVAHAVAANIGIGLPDGAKVKHWIEFKSPPPDAAWLTARFGRGLDPDRKIPDTVLHLPPGKTGPMTSLTFAAEAGAAVTDETLDLTFNNGVAAAKLHVTKDKPRAETTVIAPVGTEVKYAVRAATQVSLNGKDATYQGSGTGSYPLPADRRLVFVRDTAAGFANYRALFQEPR